MLERLLFACSPRILLICAAAFLVTLIVVGMRIAWHNKLPGRGPCPPLPMKSLGQNPILQLEFARTGANLVAVVDVGDLKDNIDHARAGNTLDTFCFIPAYAGLLSSTGLLLARQDETWRTLLCFVALIAVPVAAVCDWAENAGIAAALDHFAEAGTPQTGDAHRIATPSRIKWLVLALILLIYSGRFPEIGNDQQCARNSCCTRVCWQRGDW